MKILSATLYSQVAVQHPCRNSPTRELTNSRYRKVRHDYGLSFWRTFGEKHAIGGPDRASTGRLPLARRRAVVRHRHCHSMFSRIPCKQSSVVRIPARGNKAACGIYAGATARRFSRMLRMGDLGADRHTNGLIAQRQGRATAPGNEGDFLAL